MTVVIVAVVTVTEVTVTKVIFTYLPIWRYVGTVVTVVTDRSDQKNVFSPKNDFHKKKLFFTLKKPFSTQKIT